MAIQVESCIPLLQVFDMARSLVFYRDVLGFEVVSTAPSDGNCAWALLSLNGIQLMLNTAYEHDSRPSTPDQGRVASHADTELYFGCPDIDAAHAHLLSLGIQIAPPVVRDYGMRQLSVIDPDGYTLCFQWPAA